MNNLSDIDPDESDKIISDLYDYLCKNTLYMGHQFDAWLERQRSKYETGDMMVLFRVLHACGRCCLPLPDWANQGFLEAMDKYDFAEVETLDEAFDIKRRTKAEIREIRLSDAIAFAVVEAQEQGKSINDALMYDIAIRFGINRKYAWDLYKGWEAFNKRHHDE